jgi:hypothetical protein
MITTSLTYFDRRLQYGSYDDYPDYDTDYPDYGSYDDFPDYDTDYPDYDTYEDEEKDTSIGLRIFFVVSIFIVLLILSYLKAKCDENQTSSGNSHPNTANRTTNRQTTSTATTNNVRARIQLELASTGNGSNAPGSNNTPRNNVQTRNPPATTTARNVDPELEAIRKMTPADRKEFVDNILRHVIYKKSRRSQTTRAAKNAGHSTSDNKAEPENEGHDNSSITVSLDQCTICLEFFEDGEEVCTSQNKDCPHFFHRDCIFEWLLTNEVCPCCRRNYLHIDSVRKTDDMFVDIELGQDVKFSI